MDSKNIKPNEKKTMTQEERLALAAKLDKELDDFIAGLEKKRYTEGWPEDKWEEEMEKHPFFMTKLPEDGKLSPLLEGIQQLKYDENENSPLELAVSYKEDGNFNFKHKKYRMAIISYTEGIRKNCNNPEINAQLYSNRAAAHFHLGNYRSSLTDCQKALKIQPNYIKAKMKAINCCEKLNLHEEAIKYLEEILEKNPEDSNALKMHSEALFNKKKQERNNRKQKLKNNKLESELNLLKSAVEKRNITLDVEENLLDSLKLALEKPTIENNELCWPVFFLYPEYSVSDYIEAFNENNTFYEHFIEMFSDFPPWDIYRKYFPDALSIYYEGVDQSELYVVDKHQSLSETLSRKTYVVRNWKPSFIILVKGSTAERNFLKNYILIEPKN